MIVKWLCVRYDDRIQRVECVGETEKSIVLPNGRREMKRTNYTQYFDTWHQAREHLLSRYRQQIWVADRRAASARESLAAVEALQPPQG